MSIHIGNGNEIKNTTIAEKIEMSGSENKSTFYNRHPVICSILISLVVGFLLLFGFWKDIITFIEEMF